MNIHEGKGYMINITRLSWVCSCLIAVLLGLSRYMGLLVYCDISLKRYNILIRKTYRDISLLL